MHILKKCRFSDIAAALILSTYAHAIAFFEDVDHKILTIRHILRCHIQISEVEKVMKLLVIDRFVILSTVHLTKIVCTLHASVTVLS